MKFNRIVEKLKKERAITLAIETAEENNLRWNKDIEVIFAACCDNPALAPKLGGNNDNEQRVFTKWISKYWNAYDNRISSRISNTPSTVADPMVKTIIGTKLPYLSNVELTQIIHAHRLSMSAENILGLFLEEYLQKNLRTYGWFCGWGETIKSVDFCHEDGSLMQVKNRSNSENSSSSKVRLGTKIEKWHRVDARTGKYMWQDLNDKYSTDKFSEDRFRAFVINTVNNNPAALAIETDNLWLDQTKMD